LAVIVSFADKTTEDIYHGRNTRAARRISQLLWGRIQDKLDLLNAATSMQDLRVPPSNRLEKLSGDLAGKYSIRVNEQYRLVFAWADGNCVGVVCMDYH
jgi:toxin HigB-1